MKKSDILIITLLILFLLFMLFTSISVLANSNTGVKSYITNKKEVIILVGDSRARQMSLLKKKYKKNFVIIYSNGGTINSINPYGGDKWIGDIFVKILKKYKKAPVVLLLGVNGNYNPTLNFTRTTYYDYYIKKYRKHPYVISTVGGTGVNKNYTEYSNKKIKSFNKLLKNKYKNINSVEKLKLFLNNDKIYFYNSYQFLKKNKLIEPGISNKGTKDGLHYKNKVYIKWLADIRKFVDNEIIK